MIESKCSFLNGGKLILVNIVWIIILGRTKFVRLASYIILIRSTWKLLAQIEKKYVQNLPPIKINTSIISSFPRNRIAKSECYHFLNCS